MGNVNVDLNVLKVLFSNINTATSSIKQTRSKLIAKYQSLNGTWNDINYQRLGVVIEECCSELTRIEQSLMQTKAQLLPLVKAIQDYESISLNSSDGSLNPSSGSIPSSNNSTIRNLNRTNQSYENLFLCGRNVIVFDHPFEPNSGRVCNQGSAYPTGPRQTCGCCSSATIINKAGGSTNEHDIVNYAYNNGYCDIEGRTTPNNWCSILNGYGVSSRATTGTPLEQLATQVELGHGVIIGVNARAYAPERYRSSVGHALVLESVIRDFESGKILEYVVVDSNGTNSQDAVRRVAANILEIAYSKFGRISVMTNNIIW